MSYERLKDQSYTNLKGIDVASSDYSTESVNVLDLRNFTFEKPGSWKSRPGTAVFASLPIATYTNAPTNLLQMSQPDGGSLLLFDSGATLLQLFNGAVSAPWALSTAWGPTFGAKWDAVQFLDRTYIANGKNFAYIGYSGTQYDVNNDCRDAINATLYFNLSLIPDNGVTCVLAAGTYYVWVGTVRNYSTPPATYYQPKYYDVPGKYGSIYAAKAVLGATVVGKGQWEISFSGSQRPTDPIIPFIAGVGASFFQSSYIENGVEYTTQQTRDAVGGTIIFSGYTTVVTTRFYKFDHFTTGFSYEFTPPSSIYPKYLELFNNMLFAANVTLGAGLTPAGSFVYVSEVGNPEDFQTENYFEVRSGNGEEISAMAVYQDSLLIFKQNSTHEVIGTSPQDLSLRDVSMEYGCLSNRGVVVYENTCWFIDKKGIIEYNGANFRLVSEEIFEYLDQVDKSKIVAIHVKKKNQVWFASSQKVFAYDYNSEAWAIFDNIKLDTESAGQVLSFGATTKDVAWFETGASFHNIVRFDDTLNTDQGQAITLAIKTRFHKRLGPSTQELFRRLYIDADVPGSTQGVTILLRPDYGTSVYLAKSTFLDSFQKRIDFGVSAKSLSVELILRANQSITINGYTIESRFLRLV